MIRADDFRARFMSDTPIIGEIFPNSQKYCA